LAYSTHREEENETKPENPHHTNDGQNQKKILPVFLGSGIARGAIIP
jgi:hypothetical protein